MVNQRTHLFLIVITALTISACATPIPPEPTATPQPSPTAAQFPTSTPSQTPVPSPTQPPTVAPQATPTEPPPPPLYATSADGESVVYSFEGNLCVKRGTQPAINVNIRRDITQVTISPAGRFVVFVIQPDLSQPAEIWAVNSDGSNERRLYSRNDMAALANLSGPGGFPYQFVWARAGDFLMFNLGIGKPATNLNNDLHLINLDSSEKAIMLPPGQGGIIFPAPDRRKLALVGPDHITLTERDGTSPEVILSFPEVVTESEWRYYPPVLWTEDSLLAAVPFNLFPAFAEPPPEVLDNPDYRPPGVDLWRIPLDGSDPTLIKTLPLWNISDAGLGPQPISPGLSSVAYVGPGPFGNTELHVARLFGSGSELYHVSDGAALGFAGWLDDETFTYWEGDPSNLFEGKLGEAPKPYTEPPAPTPAPPTEPCPPG